MSARDDLDYVMDETFGIAPFETSSFFDAYRDGIAHKLAAQIREAVARDYPRVLAERGSDYAAGWSFGRLRIADEMEATQ